MTDHPLCACGCGERVRRPTAKFLTGHHMRMPEQKRRISEYRSRPEIKKKYSEERKGAKNHSYKPENHITITKPCEICGEEIETYQHKPKRFCSDGCLRKFFSQRMIGDKNPMRNPDIAKRKVENMDYIATAKKISDCITTKKQNGEYESPAKILKRENPKRYEEMCRLASQRMKGDGNPMKDPSVVEKVRKKKLGRPNPHSEQTIAKMRASKQENPTRLFGSDNGNWRGGRGIRKSRTGFCFECGEKRSTVHHHLSYIDNITIELCRRCHKFAHSGKLEHLMPNDSHPKIDREEIMERYGCECSICESREKLVIHHIDYDYMNCRDDNLIVICRRCNSGVNGGGRMFRGRDDWEEYLTELVMIKGEI